MSVNRPRLSVSTWSLHRALGSTYWDSPSDPSREPQQPYGPGSISLLELPARIVDLGIHTLEICHFHLPSRDDSYLNQVRGALDDAGVELFSLLIDDGDITHPKHQQRDMDWIVDWLETAGKLGAQQARIIAGKTVDDGAVARSRDSLRELADAAESYGVGLMTENWFEVTSKPEHLLGILEPLAGRVGLCADFGNWKGPDKYDDLAQIFPLADSCHTKCTFAAPLMPDKDDYIRCLELSREAGFAGPYTLIYDGPDDDEWAGLALEREMVMPYLS